MPDVSIGYVQGPGGFYKQSDRSGPYAIDSSGAATLITTTAGAAATAVGNGGSAVITKLDATTAGATLANLLPANAARKGKPGIYFDGAAIAYVALGSIASPTNFSVKLGQGLLTYYEPPANYTGSVSVLFSAASGSMLVTELF